jgi:hypothetical protein
VVIARIAAFASRLHSKSLHVREIERIFFQPARIDFVQVSARRSDRFVSRAEPPVSPDHIRQRSHRLRLVKHCGLDVIDRALMPF